MLLWTRTNIVCIPVKATFSFTRSSPLMIKRVMVTGSTQYPKMTSDGGQSSHVLISCNFSSMELCSS